MEEKEELEIKIKSELIEDFLVKDIKDQSKTFDQENWKTYIIFVILGFFINPILSIENDIVIYCIYIIFFTIFALASWNLDSRKIKIHTNIKSYFEEDGIKYKSYDKWLNGKFKIMNRIKENYSKELKKKALLNRISLRLLFVMCLLLTLNKIIILWCI